MWALRLAADDVSALGALRREPGVEAALVEGQLWLRGTASDEALALRLRQLPAVERYTVQADQGLLADGALVPRGYLPQAKWLPLEHWLPVVAPIATALKGIAPFVTMPLALVRDDALRQPNMLLTELTTWCDYSASAPLLRLQRWSFAANERREALIRGVPLPPIPGRQLVEAANVAIEAGWKWTPSVDATVLRRKAQAAADELLLIQPGPDQQATVEVIPVAAFVQATRSAVRLTLAGGVP